MNPNSTFVPNFIGAVTISDPKADSSTISCFPHIGHSYAAIVSDNLLLGGRGLNTR